MAILRRKLIVEKNGGSAAENLSLGRELIGKYRVGQKPDCF